MNRRVLTGTIGRLAIGGTLGLAFFALLMLVSGLHEKAWAARKPAPNFGNRPNIVLIQADDLVRSDIRYMPNVQKYLTRGGTTFTNYNAPYPLCGPARASLLTGQLAHNNEVLANFKATGFVGKFLNDYGTLDPTEIPPGWNNWQALIDQSTYDYYNYAMNLNGHVRYWGDPDYARQQMNLGTLAASNAPTSFAGFLALFHQAFPVWDYFGWQRPQDYTMDVNGRMANDFVRKSVRSRKPFFLYYATPGPHAEDTNHLQGVRPGAPDPDPRPPKRYEHTFDNVELPRPPDFNEADVSDKAANVRNLPLLDQARIDTVTASYRGRLGAVKSIDDQVGRIVKTLRKQRELGNTVIIFNSDNGYLQGEHRLAASKFLPFENSLRIPLIMRGPGIKAKARVSSPSLDVDIAPTVLAAARAKAKPGRLFDGISLLSAARKKKKLPYRDIPMEAERPLFKFSTPLTQFDLPFYGVKTSQYKYVHWSFGDIELYDMKKDPFELENIADDPGMAGVISNLEAKAAALQDCKGKQCR